MSIWNSRSLAARTALLVLTAVLATTAAQGAGRFAGIGRAATPAEIRAWDIDVRPDFKGLPAGSGSVARGQEIWDAQCASCHGFFGESNEVFNPIIGGTTPADAATGIVPTLTTSELQRTTMMKLSSLATLWDYIRRAMPWNAPKSLANDDVYAVSAYILHLADLVPAGFVLSEANLRETEKLLPNRNGMTRRHGLWSVSGTPDVSNRACMKNCIAEAKVQSFLPDYARNAHQNLALQNRTIGGVRGADTTRPAAALPETQIVAAGAAVIASSAGSTATPTRPAALATQQGCLACHGLDRKIVGPGLREIAARYRLDVADAGAIARLAEKIRMGGSGGWGDVPMPAQPQVSAAGAAELARWIALGAPSP